MVDEQKIFSKKFEEKRRINMKKNKITIIASLILCLMVVSLNTYASSGNGTCIVPLNRQYTLGKSGVTRSTNYSYINVKVYDVSPLTDGTDNFTTCKAALYSQSVPVSATSYTITEDTTARVYVKESSLSLTAVDLCFAHTNAAYKARVDFWYDGK